MMIADEDPALFRRQYRCGPFHNPSLAHHHLRRPLPVHVGARVDGVLQYRSDKRQRWQLPFDAHFSVATPIHGQTHLIGDEPQVRLSAAPGLTEFREYQLDRRLHSQIRIFNDAIAILTPVSRRYHAEQFSAPRLLFLPAQEPAFEDFQFHNA